MRRPGIAAVALLLLVAGTRLVLAAAYASPVPFWDQWDAEGANLLAPWLDGTLPASRWFDAHNEHRVLWTRLLTLGLFEANGGQWDNLVAALANCVFPGLLAALLYAGLHGGLASRSTRAVLFVGLMLLGVLPFGWENLVVGFQSQFFLMVLIAAAAIFASARLPARASSIAALGGLAVASVFTMATGLLAPAVAGAVLAARTWLRALSPRLAATAIAVLAAITLAALLAVPSVAGHQALKAQSAAEFLAAAGATFGWPFGGWGGALLLWLPTGWALVRAVRTRSADAPTLFALGLAAWALLQAAAMAYSRGHGLAAPASRYTDVLVIGLVANGWFALRAIDAWAAPRASSRDIAAALVAMVLALPPLVATSLLVRRAPGEVGILAANHRLSQVQTGRVRAYLESGDAGVLAAPSRHVPYPDAGRLRSLLDHPRLRAALPWTLRPADRDDAGAAPLSAAAAALQRVVRARIGGDAIGLPAGERAAWVATAAGRATPQWLGDGDQISGAFRMPQAGTLLRVGVQVGTAGREVRGPLRVRVCGADPGGACSDGTAALAVARNNDDLLVTLDRPLPLAAGARVRFRIEAGVGDGPPVALWLYPAPSGLPPLRIRDAAGERRVPATTPRLTLGLRR